MKHNTDASPLIAADLSGRIIYCNEAAHRICAAIAFGGEINDIFPTLEARRRRARAAGRRSFLIPSAETKCGDTMVDLTHEATHGVTRLYPGSSGRTGASAISYDAIAREFMRAAASDDNLASRRITELYDTLVSQDTVFVRGRGKRLYIFREIMEHFMDNLIPRLRSIRRGVIMRVGASFAQSGVIDCDPFAFCFMLAAVISAVGFVSDGDIVIEAEHTGKRASVSVSARLRRGFTAADTVSFGSHAPDIIYARILADAIGCGMEPPVIVDTDSVKIMLTPRVTSYYPDWLKDRPSDGLFLDAVAKAAVRLIEVSEKP